MESHEIFEKYIKNRPWTKNYDEGIPAEVTIRPEPLYAYLDRTASSYPERTAFVYFGSHVKYKTLADHSDRVAKALREMGVSKGDIVALYMPNHPAFAVAFYAAAKIGATVTPMNPLYTPGEVARQARDSEARVLFTADVQYDKAIKANEEYRFEKVIVAEMTEYMPAWLKPIARRQIRAPKIKYGGAVVKYAELLSYEAEGYRAAVKPEEDIVALMYTGGTTGTPKGAEITHANISSNLQQLKPFYDVVRRSRGIGADTPLVLVGVLPWYHIYGQVTVLHYSIFDGDTVLVYPRFDLKKILSDIGKYKASVFHGVPTIFNAIVNSVDIRRYDLTSLAFCISGSSPLPVELARRFEAATGAPLREGYGMTETAVVTHLNPLLNGRHKAGSIGLPLPSTYAAIADLEKPELLPPGQTGELVISGPQVMKGYHNRPEENKEAFFNCCGLRWFRTGDIAYMDEEGYFYIVDRKKDMIKYKGYSVFSREIEEVLYQHPCVKEAAVIGVPDQEAGEVPKAFVVLKDECKEQIKPADIIKWASERLAPYKRPRYVEFRSELPKSAVGKILKRILKEEELSKWAQTGRSNK